MRTPTLSKLLWLGVGSGIVALMFSKRRAPKPESFDADPADSVQDVDVLDAVDPLDDLDVDAMSMIDRDVDVEGTSDNGVFAEDDDVAMREGQNWVEALETSAAEDGPQPEQPLDAVFDDEDLYSAAYAADKEHRLRVAS